MTTKQKDIKMLAILRKQFGRDGKTNTQLDKIMKIFFVKNISAQCHLTSIQRIRKGIICNC